jgi:hypothetical protein
MAPLAALFLVATTESPAPLEETGGSGPPFVVFVAIGISIATVLIVLMFPGRRDRRR